MNKVKIFAGPCALESEEQINEVADVIKSLGLSWIRCGVYKPRISPHSFQGLGDSGLEILKDIDLDIITEVTEPNQIEKVMDTCSAIQIGSRNMYNYALLKEIGKRTGDFPILFKRGMSATISEYLSASEYISSAGNKNIMLCERGIRTFEDATRFTLDISAVPIIHKQTQYPICVDVSHAAGRSDLVPSMAKAAIASGADALMIEVHPNPMKALCDGPQQLNLEQFKVLIDELRTFDKELI
ncbi:MAG: 3-deoxy-7-phosphoheptulonate synthase [Coriobacteriia bacterium]|nr:3-deoxy-7-phosphoheptulonate synthase [Coriobacteriia bacterium]